MHLTNEENVPFFRLFDDLTINTPSAIKVWTSDGLSVLSLCFKKWKTVDFLLSHKDPSGWVKDGGSGNRGLWKSIIRSTNDLSAKYIKLPNKSIVPLTLLLIAT